MRMLRFTMVYLVACGGVQTANPTPDVSCDGLYGSPNENTGLTLDTCFPSIRGDTDWEPPTWDDEALAALREWILDDPPAVPTEDPYITSPDLQPNDSAVCAFHKTGKRSYRLETHASVTAAQEAGGIVTHGGACGLCSSLEELAAYAGTSDLTEPVRTCGLNGLTGDLDAVDDCIQETVGFSPACSRIWTYNTENTRAMCFEECIAALNDPYHLEDGSLNACLQCDEDNSGPVFKTVAARTRRNSGLATALCRPCETVWRLDHVYE